MDKVQYLGESLWQGQLAHAFVILGFCSALFAAFSYFKSTQLQRQGIRSSWTTLGRIGFGLHSISILGLILLIFAVMIDQRYEYSYVYEHVSSDLQMKYIFSAFWEGQEGSFMLWMFWHIVLGTIILVKGGKWEAPVLTVIALIEVFISSMILGVHIELGETIIKIGNNPTLLLRDTMDAPIFAKADYLNVIQNGTGLNPLLQNYWMTIHPPTLFLGFASTAIPFCYAVAGLWIKDYKGWLQPGLKWALFSSCIFGTGILMGGAWAYEALTFGGYWAWDPVENMSLVPWLILIAGVHTNLIAKSTGYSIKTTFLFYSLTFILVLYSTFLTRSGVLGDTSVHAFTEMGLEWQLVGFVVFFLVLSLILYFSRSKDIPVKKKEESIASREFWMYIGSLVLMFSGIIISASTSLPVYNSIMEYFDSEHIGRVINDPIPHYNKYQIWIGVFIAFLSGITVYLRYNAFNFSDKIKRISTYLIASLLIAAILTYVTNMNIQYFSWQYYILAFSAFFGIVANLGNLLFSGIKNIKMAGSALSHFGFSIMIIGVLASGLNERIISKNPFVMQGLIKNKDLARVVQLIKDEPLFAEGYWMTYKGDTVVGNNRIFTVNFKEVDLEGNTIDSFDLYPNVLYSNDFKKVAASNPSTKHYLGRDIFSSIASLPKTQMDVKFMKEMEDTLDYKPYEMFLGDTLFTSKYYGIIKNINFAPSNDEYVKESHDFGLETLIEFKDIKTGRSSKVKAALGLKDNMVFSYPVVADEFGIKVKLNEEAFTNYFTPENKLEYTEVQMKEGETISFQGYDITLRGFNRPPKNPDYKAKENDIAISAIIDAKKNGKQIQLEPVFLIRNMQPNSIKDYDVSSGLHARFDKVDPKSEIFSLRFARDNRAEASLPIQIADGVPRTDLIVLEVKEFPGINFFWLGTVSMMLGFLLALWNRFKS